MPASGMGLWATPGCVQGAYGIPGIKSGLAQTRQINSYLLCCCSGPSMVLNDSFGMKVGMMEMIENLGGLESNGEELAGPLLSGETSFVSQHPHWLQKVEGDREYFLLLGWISKVESQREPRSSMCGIMRLKRSFSFNFDQERRSERSKKCLCSAFFPLVPLVWVFFKFRQRQ